VPTGTHDEDGDGVVDECDDCPNISDPSQRPFDKRTRVVGKACQSPDVYGDIYVSAGFWSMAAADAREWRAGRSSVSPLVSFASDALVLDARASATPMIVALPANAEIMASTLTYQLGDGGYIGIGRTLEDGSIALCKVDGAALSVASLRCETGACTWQPISPATDGSASSESLGTFASAGAARVGLMLTTVSGGVGTREINCRVFDPAIPSTLRLGHARGEYALGLSIGAPGSMVLVARAAQLSLRSVHATFPMNYE